MSVWYMGLDPSLRATGYAVMAGDGQIVSRGTVRVKDTLRGPARLAHIRDSIMDHVLPPGPVVLACEGFAMSGHAVKFGRGMDLAELHGVLRVALYETGRAVFIVVPPSSLKKYATGNGTAKKPAMIARAATVFGVDVKDDNEADALHLARMARDWWTGTPVPADYREGMKKIGVLYPEPFTREVRKRKRA